MILISSLLFSLLLNAIFCCLWLDERELHLGTKVQSEKQKSDNEIFLELLEHMKKYAERDEAKLKKLLAEKDFNEGVL